MRVIVVYAISLIYLLIAFSALQLIDSLSVVGFLILATGFITQLVMAIITPWKYRIIPIGALFLGLMVMGIQLLYLLEEPY